MRNFSVKQDFLHIQAPEPMRRESSLPFVILPFAMHKPCLLLHIVTSSLRCETASMPLNGCLCTKSPVFAMYSKSRASGTVF